MPMYGLLVAVIVGASSAFVFPHSSSPPPTLLSEICGARYRPKVQSTRIGLTSIGLTSLRVSLESPSVATVDFEINELKNVTQFEINQLKNVTLRIGSGPPSKVPSEEVTPCDEICEQRIDPERIINDVEGLEYTHYTVDEEDLNGQTIASKLFNLALLAASFGYVFVSVFYIDDGMTRGWTPGEIGMRIPLDTWASYENSLSEKPIATKTIINVVIYLLGDWLSQTLFQKKDMLNFDAARTLKNGFVGACFGPAVHEYYEVSDWILPVQGMTMGITNRVFKILMDQTIYLSAKCSIFILAVGILNGDSVGSASQNVKTRIRPIMFAAWKFWPLVHVVTYGLIPARHRILWVNSVDLVWNAILASKARGEEEDDSIESPKGLVKRKGALEIEANCEESRMSIGITNSNLKPETGSERDILLAQWEEEASDAKKTAGERLGKISKINRLPVTLETQHPLHKVRY